MSTREEFEKLFYSQRSYRASEKDAFIKGCESRQPEIDALRARIAELEKDAARFVTEIDWCLENGVIGPRTEQVLIKVRALLAADPEPKPCT